jgi:hypothetical protein
MRHLGAINIYQYDDEAKTIALCVDSPSLDKRYMDIDAAGETFTEALADLLEHIEELPE